ncbi:type I restriction endonuclease subunit R [Neolewinella antarctica]|uniref:Type I restriction enzyme R subunit n=1 Tax=Neolewinella antarctica TaxID=442734 RepID=A0ABX0XEV4_9BACT|nr:DEAD/DEAH box helicase family protein [Neolewinella antarctica]NJC27747.1 type I restriction enzyme R subunit [Neolewinella antarctica]
MATLARPSNNQHPEQLARDQIDAQLRAAGWAVQGKGEVDLYENDGVAVREHHTSVGPADYVLFVKTQPIGIIEAKREDLGHKITEVEEQSLGYARAEIKFVDTTRLDFTYESTGVITRFTDHRDPKPRSREVFSFHRPLTLLALQRNSASLRQRLNNLPPLDETGLRPAQIEAIHNLEKSFADNKPRALIQMATGAGKTFTACTFAYRLLKHARARRILFLVDTKNLGEQAEQEFMSYQPRDDNRKFTELYGVQRLTSSHIPNDCQVCISTIQRLYSILKGEELAEGAEDDNPHENDRWQRKEPLPVVYNPANPVGQFDFIVIDEAHRSIYNLWRQVLEYYDAYLIGLTATPDSRTYGFFNGNVVSEYTYEESVADGVNVPFDVYTIETAITAGGAIIPKSARGVEHREKLSRRKRWEQLDEDLEYEARQLDRDVVTPDQIRTIIREYRRILPGLFPDRHDARGEFEVPKTLVFAKTDSHADDIIQIVREEMGEGNDFCKKVTYKVEEDPKSILNQFRNGWAPRIAVTVDMIATGTDVKPLEVLLFLRDVKSANYFEQMKGRGTRTISLDDLKRTSNTAKSTKTHFVIVDAVGATKSKKTLSRPLERKPGVPLKDLLHAIKMGARDEDLFSSLANRLIRLDKQITPAEKEGFKELAKGRDIKQTVRKLLAAFDPDVIEGARSRVQRELVGQSPAAIETAMDEAENDLQIDAARIFNGALADYVENVRKVHSQVIDNVSRDTVLRSEADSFSTERSREVVAGFEAYLRENTDEFTALAIYFNEPHRRREVTFRMVKSLVERLKVDRPAMAPHYVWEAYNKLEDVSDARPESELIALVSLVRRVAGLDERLTNYAGRVDRNFQTWIFNHNNTAAEKFSEEQLTWLRMIRDHVKQSFHLERDDFDLHPFDGKGGIGGFYAAFGKGYAGVILEMNEILVA